MSRKYKFGDVVSYENEKAIVTGVLGPDYRYDYEITTNTHEHEGECNYVDESDLSEWKEPVKFFVPIHNSCANCPENGATDFRREPCYRCVNAPDNTEYLESLDVPQ